MKIRINVDVKVGRVVRYLVLADLFFLFGWGLVDPVFSVFIVQKIPGATLVTVGTSAAIYWILRAILQLPIANYLDRTPGEKDDLLALTGGLLMAGLSSFAFGWVTSIWQLYLVQIIHAIAFALYVVSWPAIFSRHLDKDRISFDWSFDSTTIAVATGISGFLSGLIATVWGYLAVFIFGGILSIVAAFVLISAPDLVLPKPVKTAENVVPPPPAKGV